MSLDTPPDLPFRLPLCLNEANKPGYEQLHIFDSAEETTKWCENQKTKAVWPT
jgi:hypothetical protein